jgi:hypothetical protein
MTRYSEAGKGGDMRPTDHKKFSSGYDLIWGKKKELRDRIGMMPIEDAHKLFGTKDDAQAEDDEFERIEREQRERPCQKENPSD